MDNHAPSKQGSRSSRESGQAMSKVLLVHSLDATNPASFDDLPALTPTMYATSTQYRQSDTTGSVTQQSDTSSTPVGLNVSSFATVWTPG
jgi:hypothetical protein